MRRALVLLALVLAGCGGSHRPPAPAQPARDRAALPGGARPRRRGAACREFTAESREKLAEFGEEHLSVKPGSCRRVVARLLGSPAGAALHRLGGARITAVDLHGATAEVSVAGLDRPTQVVREGAAWRIRSEPSGETD